MFSYLKSSRNLFVIIFLFTLLFSCGGGESNEDDPYVPPVDNTVITPSDIILNVTIVGADTNNPNGNGSGTIQCSVVATNAVKYGFRFGTGSEIESTSGNVENTYKISGTNAYTVYVYAYSKTGHSISTSKNITVYVKGDNFTNLVFFDEFNTPGSPDNSKWNYNIGTGQGGWGNNESQYYTNRIDNVKIENGLLKITAKKESYQGSEYTSTRMLTQGKFDFKYGRVEVKAKLPIGKGTWPAIWMLGSNISTVGWPACGEIDIMEHVGNNQGTVQSAMHTPSSHGGTINHGSQFLADVSTAFHVYKVEWTSEKMVFSVDDKVHYTYNPSPKNSSTWPFDANQFIILNVAMGGSFGGSIDPNFTSSTMEIDYVRVYQ